MTSDETQAIGQVAVDDEANELPLIDPETGWHKLLVEQMARDIKIAHEINPKGWAVVLSANVPVLNVASNNILGVKPSPNQNFANFAINISQLLPEQEESRATLRSTFQPNATDSIEFLRLTEVSVESALLDFRTPHELAVRELANIGGLANQWQEHKSEVLQRLSSLSGVALSSPTYGSTSPTGWNRLIAELMAESIRIAHDINPNSWLLDHGHGGTVLKVGFVNMIIMRVAGNQEVVISIADDDIETEDREFARRFIDQAKAHGTRPWAAFLTSSLDSLEEVLTRLGSAQIRAVERSASGVKSKLQGWERHNDDVRKQLEDTLGVSLPSPAYFIPVSKTSTVSSLQSHSGIASSMNSTLAMIRGHFASFGLHYTDSQIATFYTALQTKGFVVLSGISGTGKSKIAQHFVELLPDKPLPVSDLAMGSTTLIPIEVTPTTLKYALVNFPRARIEQFPVSLDDPKQRLTVEFEGVSHDCAFVINTDRNSVLYRLFFSGPLRPKIVGLPLGTVMYFLPVLDDEQAVLTGFRITLDPTLELEQADVDEPVVEASRGNHLFLSVRPDWRDSTSLLGYFNPLTEHYQWTDFLRFILRAADDYKNGDRLAWFVILDEMNLAHVEYYFADLLSVIESGRGDDGFSREPLRTSFADSLDDDEVPPREIFLPPNLYIIGTVNMDETTHAFSPKVLDRAFTIELTEVDFHTYQPVPTNGAAAIDEAGKRAMLAAFTRDSQFARIDKKEVAAAVGHHPEIRDHLQSLNELLRRNRFHFGYRIFDEIAQYLHNNDRNGMMAFSDAFDAAVFMKVLPKFIGSRSRLRSPLLSLLAWAIDPRIVWPHGMADRFEMHLKGLDTSLANDTSSAPFPTVAQRALQMLETLETDGFVSFG